jgi:hypothetical protein
VVVEEGSEFSGSRGEGKEYIGYETSLFLHGEYSLANVSFDAVNFWYRENADGFRCHGVLLRVLRTLMPGNFTRLVHRQFWCHYCKLGHGLDEFA